MEETLRNHLLELARLFEAKTGITAGTVGKRALNDNTVFARLRAAETGFGVRTYDKLVRWFSENWPNGAKWPKDIERPKPSAKAGEAA